jgi:hypothetical protein
MWFNQNETIGEARDLRGRIGDVTGAKLVTTAAYAEFQRAVQDWKSFREGNVAAYPGWQGQEYVCGDGKIVSARDTPVTVGISFDVDPKFSASGSLAEWQRLVAPFVQDQPLPLFAVALGLTGPLVQLFPPAVGSPNVQLHGERNTGKSTLGILAASIWAGDSLSSVGGGETLDMTQGYFERHRETHRDSFLLLDEAENTRNAGQRRELAGSFAFRGASTQGRKRLTDEKRIRKPPLNVALMVTSNTRLEMELDGDHEASVNAAVSRVLSICVTQDQKVGACQLFRRLPTGYDTLPKAAMALRRISAEPQYGTAGPAFAKWLVHYRSRDESGLRKRIVNLVDEGAERLADLFPALIERHRYMLSGIDVAASLAVEAGVIPAIWGSPSNAINYVAAALAEAPVEPVYDFTSEWQNFRAFVREECRARRFVRMETPFIPSPTLRRWAKGFVEVNEGRTSLFIDSDYFENNFPMSRDFLPAARSMAKLILPPSERGSRYASHAPRRLKRYGFVRVFHFSL